MPLNRLAMTLPRIQTKRHPFYEKKSKSILKPLAMAMGWMLLHSNSALAQNGNSYTKGSYIEEVVVTAQKREENLQDVPIHIQAFGSDQFEKAQITRVEEIVNISPTVSFSARRGFDQTSVRIRGVGTQELGSGVEPSVATVVDGVVMARGGSTFNELPDIERVEVLNGPQGTLFGKNASVGLINIVTKNPNREEVEANFSVRATGDEDYGGKYGYSAPIDDDVAFRVSGFWRYYDGNVENIVTDNEINGVDAFGLRGKLSWQLSNSLDLLFFSRFFAANYRVLRTFTSGGACESGRGRWTAWHPGHRLQLCRLPW